MILSTCRLITKRFETTIKSSLIRNFSKIPNESEIRRKKMLTTAYYMTSLGVVFVGLSYAAVPLYRIFCQAYSYGGTVGIVGHDSTKIENLKPLKDRIINIRFNADTGATMRWNFKPQQSDINVIPGETVLAFYTATNPTDLPVTGVSTYNVIPFEAGQYFNKIQCFCFEEQQLNPHEQVDMPVFFYVDPEFAYDPRMEHVDQIVLSYTFFEAKEGLKLPIPSYIKKHFDKQNVTTGTKLLES
ncbi:cytochrome c oxidase assembly protein COX11, mitochondrial [Leptopilina boulardi]|uniref:cytochrome c oxidase assembly protein COX11, mitochondrial n=1 Tax=Leptopilina boulardi TaxID=63433 RepID=UPI0021F5C996|nr:cytochrome c oxidase assembly protein COX11, mitochondrial [Leptopilina boulardi]